MILLSQVNTPWNTPAKNFIWLHRWTHPIIDNSFRYPCSNDAPANIIRNAQAFFDPYCLKNAQYPKTQPRTPNIFFNFCRNHRKGPETIFMRGDFVVCTELEVPCILPKLHMHARSFSQMHSVAIIPNCQYSGQFHFSLRASSSCFIFCTATGKASGGTHAQHTRKKPGRCALHAWPTLKKLEEVWVEGTKLKLLAVWKQDLQEIANMKLQ